MLISSNCKEELTFYTVHSDKVEPIFISDNLLVYDVNKFMTLHSLVCR